MSHGHEHSHDSAGAWWVARPENADKLFYGLVAACTALVAFDLVYHNAFHAKHGYFSFETAIGFHAVYGFVAFLFVVLSGTHLRNFLMRAEDYYDVPYTTPEGGHDHGHGHGGDDHGHGGDDHGHGGDGDGGDGHGHEDGEGEAEGTVSHDAIEPGSAPAPDVAEESPAEGGGSEEGGQ